MNILHLINDLRVGGTEKSLVNYCINDNKNYNIILSFGPSENFVKLLESKNIKLIKLNILKNPIKTILNLRKIIKENDIKIVHSWMYHSHLISFIFYFFGIKVFWSIRNQDITKNNLGNKTFLLVKLLSFLSNFFVERIFYNSRMAKTTHTNMGFPEKKSQIVFNGFFTDDREVDQSDELVMKLKSYRKMNYFILGSIGRYHEVKNQLMFLQSLKQLKEKSDLKFLGLFVGKGFEENSYFLKKIKDYNLNDNIFKIEFCENMKKIYSLIDLSVLTSKNESFPNVVAESMMYGTPSISTDVGEVRKIISDYGWIINNDVNELSEKILEAQSMKKNSPDEWNTLRDQCKNHIKNNFSLNKMFESFERGYKN